METEQRESVESPWLLCIDNLNRELVYCNVTQRQSAFRCPIDPWKNTIFNYNHGWMLFHDGYQFGFMLFNPKTRQTIPLPIPPSKPNRCFNAGILWLSPENPMSKVLLFDMGHSTTLYCNIHEKLWIEVSYKTQAKKIVGDRGKGVFPAVNRPVYCNDRLYAFLFFSKGFEVVEIDIVEETQHLQIKPLGSKLPVNVTNSNNYKWYRWWLAESQGELFAINVVSGEPYAKKLDAKLFRLDFNSAELGWRYVKGSDINDRAFFLSHRYQPLACTIMGQEFKGGRVYYISGISQHLYSYDVEDGNITVSMLSPSEFLDPYMWVMLSNPRVDREEMKKKKRTSTIICSDDREEMKKKKRTSTKNFSERKWINFLDLTYDIMETVAKKIRPVDCKNLQATCKACCQLTPLIRWGKRSSSVQLQPHSIPPWLMFSTGVRTVHHFIDMKFGGTFTIEANKLLYDAKVRYSKNGWVLMTDMHDNLFFYNPFSKEVIKLPERLEHAAEYDKLCFTDIPTSPECIVMGITSGSVCLFDIRHQCRSFIRLCVRDLPIDNNTPIFFKGAFYILDANGICRKLKFENGHLSKLHMFRYPWRVFHQNFLLEWNGKLTIVLINSTWMCLEVFTLNETRMAWEQVWSLGKSSFFLSCFSAFSITTNIPELDDKIYLSKIYEDEKIIFYCLKTKRFGYTTSEKEINSFQGTKEYIPLCWIQPSCSTSSTLLDPRCMPETK